MRLYCCYTRFGKRINTLASGIANDALNKNKRDQKRGPFSEGVIAFYSTAQKKKRST